MNISWDSLLTALSIVCGLISAACWCRSSFVKVSHEEAIHARVTQAQKKGEKPNLASVSLDGWDMSATFAAQSRWNASGSAFAALSILLQSLSQMILGSL